MDGRSSFFGRENGIRFHLDQVLFPDQAADLDQGIGGADVPEELGVGAGASCQRVMSVT